MFNAIETHPLSARKDIQKERGIHNLPLQDLCYATYTFPDGTSLIVELIGTDERENLALLSYKGEESPTRVIWLALRDQTGTPDSWLWTNKQVAEARLNPVRITDEENDFLDDDSDDLPIQLAPLHRDRRIELLMLGLELPLSDDEVREQLRAEGLDDTLPANYRTREGEEDLLRNWLPAKATSAKPSHTPGFAQPQKSLGNSRKAGAQAVKAIKFSGKSKKRK
ncbi:MAG TPA: hypothetical protein VGD98_09050 [Ktedonobacteraceae bacterium]